jgi:hypothetical protein
MSNASDGMKPNRVAATALRVSLSSFSLRLLPTFKKLLRVGSFKIRYLEVKLLNFATVERSVERGPLASRASLLLVVVGGCRTEHRLLY